jgi:competence protein ComEA
LNASAALACGAYEFKGKPMLKKFLAILATLTAAMAFAAVDVNKATVAELDGVKGIGPGISSKILDERKKGDFKDWSDLIERVKGVGEKNAAKFSTGGLTVNGSGFNGAPATAIKKDEKATTKEAKVDAKKSKTDAVAADKPAPTASAAKK